jgi:prefoldin subunit 5
MPGRNLNRSEIKDLLERYESELRKLEFQIDRVNRSIGELQERFESAPSPIMEVLDQISTWHGV